MAIVFQRQFENHLFLQRAKLDTCKLNARAAPAAA
jgi:hypothetical protein